MADDTDIDDPEVPPPPVEGELLPRAVYAFGTHVKLATYSLNVTHKDGGPKARGFEKILGITIEHIDYLEGAWKRRRRGRCCSLRLRSLSGTVLNVCRATTHMGVRAAQRPQLR